MNLYYNLPYKPQFFGVLGAASNVGTSSGGYTADMFAADFPQFFDAAGVSWAPQTVLDLFVSQADASLQPEKWLESWRYACGLYVAHQLTLYLRSFASSSPTAAGAAESGQITGTVKRATLGDATVEYDTSAATAATSAWGALNSTQYGLQLADLARRVGMAGSYVL